MSSTLTPNIFGGQSGGGGGGAVTSVNGQIGAVALDTDDIPEGTTNLYFDDTRVYDKAKDALVAGTNVTITPDDIAETLTISASGGGGAVNSVNGQIGDVVLNAADVGAVALTGNETIAGEKRFTDRAQFDNAFYFEGIPSSAINIRSPADLDAQKRLTINQPYVQLNGNFTGADAIRGFIVPTYTDLNVSVIQIKINTAQCTFIPLAGSPVQPGEEIITFNSLEYNVLTSGNGQLLTFYRSNGSSQSGWYLVDSASIQLALDGSGSPNAIPQRNNAGTQWEATTSLKYSNGNVAVDLLDTNAVINDPQEIAAFSMLRRELLHENGNVAAKYTTDDELELEQNTLVTPTKIKTPTHIQETTTAVFGDTVDLSAGLNGASHIVFRDTGVTGSVVKLPLLSNVDVGSYVRVTDLQCVSTDYPIEIDAQDGVIVKDEGGTQTIELSSNGASILLQLVIQGQWKVI